MIGTKCETCLRVAIICLYTFFVTGQPGFLSIDCGSIVNYTDSITGIQWTTDEGYIQTGTNSRTVNKSSTSLDNLTQLWDYRSFDQRQRNCYVLPVENSTVYLVRGSFKFIDVDLLLNDLSFQLFLDSTPWVRVTYSSTVGVDGLSPDAPRVFESVIRSTSRELLVCLVQNQGRPFISALELRKLDEGMYMKPGIEGTEFGKILVLAHRINLGAPQDLDVRYPDDSYDRIWRPYQGDCPETIISSKPVQRQPDEYKNDPRYTLNVTEVWQSNRVPTKVMEDACVGADSSLFIELTFPVTVQRYYGVLYLQEIDDNASETNVRGIEIEVKNENETALWNVSRTAAELSGLFLSLKDFVWTLTLTITPWSQLQPLANALEFYLINDTSNSKTESSDTIALGKLKASLNLLDYVGDPCYPVPWDWLVCNYTAVPSRVTKVILSDYGIEGFLDPAIGAITELTELLLDNNHLTGEIPDLRRMTGLQRVHLQHNSFNGPLPEYLLDFQSLLELDVTSNNLSGGISSCPRSSVKLSCGENPLLHCESKLRNCIGSGRGTDITKLAGGVVGGFVFLSILVVALICIIITRRRRHAKKEAARLSDEMKTRLMTRTSKLPSLSDDQKSRSAFFTMDQVVKMTNKYQEKIGEGSYGAVYLGELPSGRKVAVKVHKASSRQGMAEFMNEVNLLSRVHHRNLVSLLGYCEESDQQILIYDYLGNGTLREHLYGPLLGTSPLDWKARLDIAIDSAKGLEYLHKDCHPQIIHRDVKSSNILLDDQLVAKVADFGLSKAGPDEGFNSGVSTVVKGTPGYFDPEYFMTQRVTHKSDVYSYGIVLLELLSGLPPYNSQLPDGCSGTLLEWVQKQYPANILAIIDTKLEGQYNEEVMKKVIELAVSCIALQSVHRPDMEHIVRALCEVRDTEFPDNEHPPPSESADFFFSHMASSSITDFSYPSTTNESVSFPPPRQLDVEYPSSLEASYQHGR